MSVLSPLLFLVFTNDLPKGVSQPTTVDIFADDTTLSLSSPYKDTSGLYVLRSVRAPVNSRTGLELNRFKSNTENEDKVYVCNWK